MTRERVLITGATRGIGRAIAEALGQRGARLACAVRDPEGPMARDLRSLSQDVALVQVELRDRAQVASLVARASAELGGLDALVNCAGVVLYEGLAELTPEALYEQFEINCFAPSLVARDAAHYMAAHGGGAIVNVASTLGLKPAPLTAAYSASKAALISMTRSLALEYAGQGVRVNAVAPGIIDTDMIRAERKQADGSALGWEEQLEALRKLHPVGRLGSAGQGAEAVLYLLHAKFVTGTVLVADGGLLLT